VHGGVHGDHYGKCLSTGSGQNRPQGGFNLEVTCLFSLGYLAFWVAQELQKLFADDSTGNDSDARVKNRAGIEKQWNLR
jgi:hypothetical protein